MLTEDKSLSKSAKKVQNAFNEVRLHGNRYQVLVDGDGSVPCLCVGMGSLCQRTMSDRFRELFTLYTSDFYWVKEQQSIDIKQLTIETICRDII